MFIINLIAFLKLSFIGFVPTYAHTNKVWECLFPILCQYCIILIFFIFAKAYVKNSISEFNLYFSYDEWCRESFIWLRTNCISYFVSSLLIVHIICLFSWWAVGFCLWFVAVTFILRKLNLCATDCKIPPWVIYLLKQKATTSWNAPILPLSLSHQTVSP